MMSDLPTPDYSVYILAVYLLAVLGLGGAALWWQLQLRRLERTIHHLRGQQP